MCDAKQQQTTPTVVKRQPSVRGPIFDIIKEFQRPGCGATQRAMAMEIHRLRTNKPRG